MNRHQAEACLNEVKENPIKLGEKEIKVHAFFPRGATERPN
jgi:hypothetical protein